MGIRYYLVVIVYIIHLPHFYRSPSNRVSATVNSVRGDQAWCGPDAIEPILSCTKP